MEVVEDESIATKSTAASKLYGKSYHRMDHHGMIDTTIASSMKMMDVTVTTNGSNLSVDTHPPSTRSKNPFSEMPSSCDTFDSRHDSPKEEDDSSDDMMTSDDPSNGNPMNSCGFVPPPPNKHSNSNRMPLPPSMRIHVTTEDTRASINTTRISSISTFAREEKVSLVPRFGRLESSGNRQDEKVGDGEEPELRLQDNSSLFSLTGSMSSEFLEHQQHHPDHQQEYLRHPNGLAMGMASPTSTTARDFLREVQCPPPIPGLDGEREGIAANNSTLHYRRPPFHPPSAAAATSNNPSSQLLSSSTTLPIFPPLPSQINNKKSHPTLLREHILSSSPSNASIPGVGGSFSCDNGGRDKPVISRCFAWSMDSQDDRRITKRARTVHQEGIQGGMTSSASSPLSTDTIEVMSPTSALATIRGTSADNDHHTTTLDEPSSRQILPIHHLGDSPPPLPSTPPTKLNWDEKVEHSNELMSHAVDHQVLFRTTRATAGHGGDGNEDVAMGDESNTNNKMPPPITTAHSASRYSFDSL